MTLKHMGHFEELSDQFMLCLSAQRGHDSPVTKQLCVLLCVCLCLCVVLRCGVCGGGECVYVFCVCVCVAVLCCVCVCVWGCVCVYVCGCVCVCFYLPSYAAAAGSSFHSY